MGAERPVSLLGIGSAADFGRADVPVVEIFTAAEQRSRTSQAYVRSAVGTRLRYLEHSERTTETAEELVVVQRDERSGLVVRTSFVRPVAAQSVRVQSVIENPTERSIVLTAVTTPTFGFGASERDLDRFTLAFAESEWLAENRWQERPAAPDASAPRPGAARPGRPRPLRLRAMAPGRRASTCQPASSSTRGPAAARLADRDERRLALRPGPDARRRCREPARTDRPRPPVRARTSTRGPLHDDSGRARRVRRGLRGRVRRADARIAAGCSTDRPGATTCRSSTTTS